MLAAAVVLLGSVAAAALLPAGLVLAVPLPVPREAELPILVQVRPGREVLVLARVPPEPLLLHLLSFKLRQVVVESEVPLHRLGRQSFSAAMAGSTRKPRATYEPVPRSG